MRIAEVMTTDVEVIDSNAPLTEAAAKMKTLDVGLLPICDGDKLKGTLTDRDITVRGIAEGFDPSDTKVSDIMSTDIAYCFEDEEIDKALSVMEVRQIRRLPV
jgi:CBS domain-containing protein